MTLPYVEIKSISICHAMPNKRSVCKCCKNEVNGIHAGANQFYAGFFAVDFIRLHSRQYNAQLADRHRCMPGHGAGFRFQTLEEGIYPDLGHFALFYHQSHNDCFSAGCMGRPSYCCPCKRLTGGNCMVLPSRWKALHTAICAGACARRTLEIAKVHS